MPQKQQYWHRLFEEDGMWAWISADGTALVWQLDRSVSPADKESWAVADIMTPGFEEWPGDVGPTRKMIRKWLSKRKPWIALVKRVHAYQRKMR